MSERNDEDEFNIVEGAKAEMNLWGDPNDWDECSCESDEVCSLCADSEEIEDVWDVVED